MTIIFENIPCLILNEDSPYFQIFFKNESIIIDAYRERRLHRKITWNDLKILKKNMMYQI